MNNGGLVSWDSIDKIYMQMRETQEDFIFSTISPYITNTTQITVNKELLVRAVTEYFQNHPEEYCKEINIYE